MIYENLTCVCDRAREIIWEWLQANDIWQSTSFPGPSCRKERKRTTVFCSGRGTPLLQCAEENGTRECRRCSCHYIFSICRHLAILLWTYVLMYAAGKSRTKTVQGKTIQGKLCFFPIFSLGLYFVLSRFFFLESYLLLSCYYYISFPVL
jgi:hypothetical protein